MLSIEDRAELVLAEAWRLLPPIKDEAWISGIALTDIGQKHGSYNPDSGLLTLSTRLFWGSDASELMYIDQNGHTPPIHENYTARSLHTAIHEAGHAIGSATDLDMTPEWLALSGWQHTTDEQQGYGRYHERRPGWHPHGPSEWRFRLGTWFVRPYSSKSPGEDFADCVAHIALGWHQEVNHPVGRKKMQYIVRHVWQQTPAQMLQASSQKWRQRFAVA